MKTKLQERRKAAGYRSAKEFAEKMGMSIGTYTDYEQGRRKFTLEKAWEFADVLGCTLDELAGRNFQPDCNGTLTSEENKLIGLYRDANPQGKATIMGVAAIQPGMEDASHHGTNKAG